MVLRFCFVPTTSKIAATHEAVDEQARQMKQSQGNGTVASVRTRQQHAATTKECYRCGSTTHFGSNPSCPARGKTCRRCGGANHYEKKCRSKNKEKDGKGESQRGDHKKHGEQKHDRRRHRRYTKRVNQLDAEDSGSESDEEPIHVFMTRETTVRGNKLTIQVGGVPVDCIVDSGCDINIISERLWSQLKSKMKHKVKKCTKKLYPYTSDKPLETVCCFEAEVQAGDNQTAAEFVVIREDGDPLLSRGTSIELKVLRIGMNIQNVAASENEEIETEFKPLFTGFGKLNGRQIKLTVDPTVKPVAQPVRRTPFGLRSKVEAKVKELIDKDIIEPVEKPTPWVSPVVIVPKAKGDIRMCVDMRRVNEAVMRERHPIPTIEELLQDMAESRVFSKLDLKMGYHQLELHPDSRDITTFVTHCGLYRYKRLVMGINAASEIYQHEIHQVVQGIPGVANLSDDIIIHAPDREQHDQRLKQTLRRLQDAGLTLNAEKCFFRRDEIEFLGHKLSARGINPAKDKVEAVIGAREPECVSEVRSFLVNYCSRFIPDYATLTEPLRKLTRKNVKFQFGEEQKNAFKVLKDALASADTLGYYDPSARTQIICDASPVGLGAILVQRQTDGHRIVSYASRSLTAVEKRYSQTEKEALAIVWGCEKFHPYIYGQTFDLLTDHKPLQVIYGPRSKPSARIERWVLRLQAYTFKVIYIPGKANIADPLSRLLPTTSTTPTTLSNLSDEAEEHVRFVTSNATPCAMTTDDIEQASAEDPELETVRKCIETGKWHDCDKLYAAVSPELCTSGNIVLRGGRIVIPKALRNRVLTLAHEGHLGVVGTKQNLRTKVWWPRMEKDAERFCRSCPGCQLVSRTNPPEPIKSTKLPSAPWEDIALDFLGPLPSGHSVLVVIDYYSRYYEISVMKSTTADKTVTALKTIFARHGYPLTIHTDNGPQFVSDTFANYMEIIGAKHIRVTPRWPQANGEVERQNQSLLKRMRIAQAEGKYWQEEILNYLTAYRANPHPSTGRSPAELLFGRRIRTKMPQLPNDYIDLEVHDRDAEKKGLTKLYADQKRRAVDVDIMPGDTVLLKRDQMSGKLDTPFLPEPFEVIEKAGSKVTVESASGARYSRNSSHVKKFHHPETVASRPRETICSADHPVASGENQPQPKPIPTVNPPIPTTNQPNPTPAPTQLNTPTPLRRSERTKMKPKKLEDYVEK